jgi:hypothetical protein
MPEEALTVRVPSKVFDPFGVVAMAVVHEESEKAESAMLAVELVTVFPSASSTFTTGWIVSGVPEVVVPVGSVVNESVVAVPGFTVRFAPDPTALESMVAPIVTAPARIPVNSAVYTPDPAFVIPPKVPVPALVVEVNAMAPTAGRPEGTGFP